LGLCISYSPVFWLCFGVATFLATRFNMGMLVVLLLHGFVLALLQNAKLSKYTVHMLIMEESRTQQGAISDGLFAASAGFSGSELVHFVKCCIALCILIALFCPRLLARSGTYQCALLLAIFISFVPLSE
jgi:hypothetical protein